MKIKKKILSILLISVISLFAVTSQAQAIAPALAGEALWTAITMLEGQGIYYNNMTNATEGANVWYARLSESDKEKFVNSVNNAVTLGSEYIYIDSATGQYFPLSSTIYDDIQRYKINTDRITNLLTGGYKLVTYCNSMYDNSVFVGYIIGAYILDSNGLAGYGGMEYWPVQVVNAQIRFNDALDGTFLGFKSVTGRSYSSGDIFNLPYRVDYNETYDEYGDKLGKPYIPYPNEQRTLDKYVPIPKTLADAEKHLNVTNDPSQTYPKIQTGQTVYNPDTQTTEEYKKPLVGEIPTSEPTTEIGFWGTVSQLLTNISTTATNTYAQVQSIATSITDFFSPTVSPEKTISFAPLEVAGEQFSNKFPFSLPWDIYRMLQSFSERASTSTPSLPIRIPIQMAHFGLDWNFEKDISLEFMAPYIPAAKLFEIIAFSIGLVFATRKYMGGDV